MKNLSLKKLLPVVILICLDIPLMAQQITITVNSRDERTGTDNFSNLEQAFISSGYDTPEKIAAITDLKLITEGTYTYNEKEFAIALEYNDMNYLNIHFPSLANLDLSNTKITDNYGLGRSPNNNFPRYSFQNNTSIKSIILPSTLTNIGTDAFTNCALEGIIKIPVTVNGATNVDYNRFGNSQGIKGFEADPASTTITTIEGVVFNKDISELHYYPSGKEDKDYTIPEGVTTIRNSAFEHNHYLKNLTFSSTVANMQATQGDGSNRYDVIADHSEIENIFVAPENTVFGSINGILYQIKDEKAVWSPRGKTELKLSTPIKIIAGGGSQNSMFGGNGSNGITKVSNNYTFIITLVDLPPTLLEIGDGAFVAADNLSKIISRSTIPPTIGKNTFRSVGGSLTPQWSTQIYVPASSLEQYTTSPWIGSNGYSGFNAESFFGFYNIITTNAIAQSSIANDIAPENDLITITANLASEPGKIFDKWTTTTEGVVFADATNPTTTFIMPASDVEITATYKELGTLENIGDNIDAIFSGKWDESVFNEFVQVNAAKLTTIDLTDVTELTQVPVIANLSPNCLIYVNAGVTGNEGQNIIIKDGTTYTSDNIILSETSNDIRNNSFNNTHEFTGNISYSRDFSNTAVGKFASICLPFTPINHNELDGLEFEAFDKVTVEGDKASLNFITINTNELEANVPYIVKLTQETGTITFKGSSVPETTIASSPTSEGYTLNGNFRYTDNVTAYYLLQSDGSEFAKGAENSYITAFRAYLSTEDNTIRKLTVTHNDNGSTTELNGQATDKLKIYAVNDVIYIQADNAQSINVYSIDGRIIKVAELAIGENTITGIAKGIYLINNQKVVIK